MNTNYICPNVLKSSFCGLISIFFNHCSLKYLLKAYDCCQCKRCQGWLSTNAKLVSIRTLDCQGELDTVLLNKTSELLILIITSLIMVMITYDLKY